MPTAGRAITLAVAIGLLAASGCGLFGRGKSQPSPQAKPEARKLELTFTGSDLLNSCGQGVGNALVVRLYQLSRGETIQGLTLSQLWDREKDELQDELLGDPVELILEPNGKKTIPLPEDPEAKFLAVAGNFCRTEGDCWLWIRPCSELARSVALEFGQSCIRERSAASR